jgi:hypothetical protein
MTTGAQLTMTPEDILKYQNDLIRTGKHLPLGRMKVISIGPNDGCPELPTWDPIMKKFGRLIQLRDMAMPIAQSPDRSMILVPAPLLDRNGRVRLPDLPDPTWRRENFTEEEVVGRETIDPATGKTTRIQVRDPQKDLPRMCEQSLLARAEGYMANSTFYVFSPVLSIAFQPETDGRLLGTYWAIECTFNPADRTHPALLIDAKTGETHFFGGLYNIVRAVGEN